MKKFQSIIACCLILIILITLPGCNVFNTNKKEVPKKKVSLKIWQLFDSPEIMQPIINDYIADRADTYDITIDYQEKEYIDYVNTTTNALAAGQGPDIWMIRNDWVARQYDKLEPMPDSIMSLDTYKSLFPDVVVNDNVIDDKIYGLPWSVDTLALYYNPAIFNQVRNQLDEARTLPNSDRILENAPSDWEELIRASNLLTIKNGKDITRSGIALGTADNITNSVDILSMLMLQNHTQMVSDDKNAATFNLAIQKESGEPVYSGTKALEFYNSFSNPNKDNYTWNGSMPDSVQAFMEGKTAMMINYSYVQKTLFEKAPTFRYNISPLPQIKDAATAVDYTSYWTETVTTNCQNTDVAWDFIKYVAEKQINTYLSATKRPSPFKIPSEDVPIVQKRSEDPGATFKFQVNTAQDWYKGKFPQDVDAVFDEMIVNVNNGQAFQSAIDASAAKTTTLLQKQPY